MTTDLIIPQDLTPEIFSNNGLDSVLEKIKNETKNFKGSVLTASSRKEIASFAYKISRSKTALDELGKKLVEGAKAEIKKVDNERKRVREELDILKESVRKPLTDWEKKEDMRIIEHKEHLNELSNLTLISWVDHSEVQMQEYLSRLDYLEKRSWEEFNKNIPELLEKAKKTLNEGLEAKKEFDRQQLELEKLRAEKIEAQRIEEERIRKENEQKRIRKAEEDAVERERLRAEKIEAQRLEEDQARQADKIYRQKIFAEIIEDFSSNGITNGELIVELLSKQHIRHLFIKY